MEHKNDYQSRLRKYDLECKNLLLKNLSPEEYEKEIRRLAMIYDV